MTRNPYINALAAAAYIVGVVLLITYGPTFVRDKPDTIFAPMAMLSLLVFSVSFMGYTFFYQPVLLYVDGKKQEAVQLFVKTLGTFAIFTIVVLALAFTRR